MTSVIWVYDSFENNFSINNKLKRSLKKRLCVWVFFFGGGGGAFSFVS